MGDALHLKVVVGGREIVEQQHGALLSRKELLEHENLAAVAQRVPGEQAQLRQRVDHHAGRLGTLDLGKHDANRLAQLDFRWMEHRVLRSGLEAVRRGRDLPDRHAVERPAVRSGCGPQLFFRFGQRDVEHRLAGPGAFGQEPKRERGLAGSGDALHHIQPVPGKPSAEHVVEPVSAGLSVC